MTVVRRLLADLAALVWPTECVSCGAADRDCCEACRARVRGLGAPLRSTVPVPGRRAPVPVLAAGLYDEVLRALIIGLKHAGRVGFARELGAALRPAVAAAWTLRTGPDPPVIVAVPSRAARVRQRGYRHVELVLRPALRGAPPHLPMLRALRPVRGRTGQVGLDAAARRRNAALVAVRRRCREALRGREVILVDDVVTTGATVAATCTVLETAGATVIAVVAIGIVRRRDDRGWKAEGERRYSS